MAISDAGFEACAVSRPEYFLPVVGNQDDLALQDPGEFVLGGMPVALAGPRSRRQLKQIDAEVAETCGIAESLPHTFAARCIEWLGVVCALASRNGGLLDFHCTDSGRTPPKLTMLSCIVREDIAGSFAGEHMQWAVAHHDRANCAGGHRRVPGAGRRSRTEHSIHRAAAGQVMRVIASRGLPRRHP
jgi:hypothetical protein